MPLHHSLPIVFSDGTELARFAVDCAQCRRSLAGDLVRGRSSLSREIASR